MKQRETKNKPSMIIYAHRETLVDDLRNTIIEIAQDENWPFYKAAPRVLLSWLGYQSKDVTFVDGKDSGIDAWYFTDNSSNTGIEIFQIKTHQLTSGGLLCLDPFDNTGVNDLIRAKNLLCFNEGGTTSSQKIKEFLSKWSFMIRDRKIQEISSPMLVNLNLVILGDSLTPQAQEEFDRFQKLNEEPIIIDGVTVQFNTVLYAINSMIGARWRGENREWKDIFGKKQTNIRVKPIKEGGHISDNKNAVFYCAAIDLVNAYARLGYQLFEPNVRAEIKRSRVNDAIRESVRHARSRKDFRFLNNGVTITCESSEPPKGVRKEFVIHYPGVVNGLQTVVALHTAYNELPERDKEDFEINCSVLVRLLNKNAVDDITDVVRATNNQNQMKSRNLVSNSPEQIGFARIFAENLGWFYEAKEGAWNAFEKDYKRWRPSLNKTNKDFYVSKTKGRGRIRKVDNHVLAQTWLAFIGLAGRAAEEKEQLFDSELYYNLIFKTRTSKHGSDYDFSPKAFASGEDLKQTAPNAPLMLVAYLSYMFVKQVVPTPQQNRKETCERLGLSMNDFNVMELDIKLADEKEGDHNFVLNQALRHMPLLFTEFVGFILYRALGENIHNYGQDILSNHSFDLMRREFNPESIKQKIDNEEFAPNDLLVVLWLMFFDKIEDLMAGNWGKNYRKANRKPRFVLAKENRNRLYKDIQEQDKFMKQRLLTKIWAIGVEEHQGLFEFIKKCVFEKSPQTPKEPELFNKL